MNHTLKSTLALAALLLGAYSAPQPAAAQSTAHPPGHSRQPAPPALTRPTGGFAPRNLAGLAQATFAGGCFWAQEEAFEEIKGVRQVVSGYAGGTTQHPTYEEVAGQRTGHTETVNIYYDPKVVSYQTLADIFFRASHDPTQLNRQGPDVGPEYRSAAFYRTPEEKKILEATIARVNASGEYRGKIVTEVRPLQTFWPAEDYHQGYYRAHPENGYLNAVSAPKVEHVRRAFPQALKEQL